MLDWAKAFVAVLLAMFGAGAAWANLRARDARTRSDLNRMGSERVKKVEDAQKEMIGAFGELRLHVDERHERMLEHEAQLRERLAAAETRLEMLGDERSAERADRARGD